MEVVVFPERCVGCMQCMFQCSVEHSKSKNVEAVFEEPKAKPRIRIYPSQFIYSFPSKCRHCNPAPCLEACPTSAIKRSEEIVYVEVERCINCGMCAMVCPFGVIRFYEDWRRPNSTVSYKCDGCIERVSQKMVPACVEACKTGALKYGNVNDLLKEEERRIATTFSPLFKKEEIIPENYALWLSLR